MRTFPLVNIGGKWQVPVLENENLGELVHRIETSTLNERVSFFINRFGFEAILESSATPITVLNNCNFFELKGL